MCVAPDFMWIEQGPTWAKQVKTCGHCWQCRGLRIDDFVGRCLAEKTVSDWCVYLTLTYRDSEQREADLAHRILNTRHLQKWVRSLRRRGHSIRYFAAGEYGETKGRAHFHAIVFGRGFPVPSWKQGHDHCKSWPHGHVDVEWNPGHRAMRYVAKYLLKTDAKVNPSKKPPLGHEWFMLKAERDFALGLIPSSWAYIPPGGSPNKLYLMRGTTRLNYLKRLVELAELPSNRAASIGERHSEWVQLSLKKVERQLREADMRDDPSALLDQLMDEIGRPWHWRLYNERRYAIKKVLADEKAAVDEQRRIALKYGPQWHQLGFNYDTEAAS